MNDIPVYLLQDYLPEGAEDFYILDCGPIAQEHATLHRHDFYEFYTVIRGEFVDECNDRKTPMQPRATHIARPQDAHRIYCADPASGGLMGNIAGATCSIRCSSNASPCPTIPQPRPG